METLEFAEIITVSGLSMPYDDTPGATERDHALLDLLYADEWLEVDHESDVINHRLCVNGLY